MLICAIALFIVLAGGTDASAQNADTIVTSQGVVLAKLSDPVYPPITRTAHISGDVELMLGIRQDGSVESATVVSGPPLLQKAALASAQQSTFECHGCGMDPTSYRLKYSFQLVESGCCAAQDANATDKDQHRIYPAITQSQGHVTIVDQAVCICDPASEISKVRSVKCLYLWKCAVHRW